MSERRDVAIERLGTKYKTPSMVTVNEGEDRFARVARANSGNKTVSAKARAFSGGVPNDWTPVTDGSD